jgi:hypothetical protein
MKQLVQAFAVILVAMSLSPAFAAKKLLADIPLIYKPTESKGAGVVDLTGLTEKRIEIAPLADNRADQKTFGVNREDATPRPVTTSSNVAEFCTQHLTEDLQRFGFVITSERPEFVLSGEVLEFMVNEASKYNGDVRLKMQLSKDGKAVWTGLVSGTSARWGRSYKAENYYETISDSLLHAIENLAMDTGFAAALRK